MTFTAEDHAFMARALQLAERGRETAPPNPNVGCVIVKAGRIIGEGWHARAGEPHAERLALAACTESPQGATAYVTLEPCAHQGRTGPCADALVEARVGRVVAAIEDPFPQVQGRGFARLREAGIRAEVGCMAAEAEETHREFLHLVRRGRPWMRIKAAASLDGRIALADGESRWITGEAARRDVHALRARSAGMLTGVGTVLADDPELTVRHVPCARQPRRILVDSRLDVPPTARLLRGEPPIVFTLSRDAARRERIAATGARLVDAAEDAAKPGKIDLAAMARTLGRLDFPDVTVETGTKLNGSLLAAGVIDEIVLYVAPMLLGDASRGLFALPGIASLDAALRPRIVDVRMVGPDLRITARMAR
ncbi:MAG TPA: bifunctional diaminohydroxyphosphoribosylaminopyrimidine deaminase/5-amino-6-(5-phosphoribosylamino)uracil reductase RibD [Usitatibacter sp.]|nr:bifunctional diaminohydroxyphosphoribosylaminopyrimidine deaminase/5-amino-6-(5-phosphoribosylamino)uracil reductase RibD [Usitatibacter sp.]